MEQSQALNILVQTAELAVQKGGFKLAEAKVIAEAVEAFSKKEEAPKEPKKK
jgi:hypothetical protein